MPAATATGFKGISYLRKPNLSKPYQVQIKQGGKQHSLGTFTTSRVQPRPPALAVARHLNVGRSAVQAAQPPCGPHDRRCLRCTLTVPTHGKPRCGGIGR